MSIEIKQEALRVVTIAIICSILAPLGKFQYFRRSIYNPDDGAFIPKIISR